jgi:hypothetical protein
MRDKRFSKLGIGMAAAAAMRLRQQCGCGCGGGGSCNFQVRYLNVPAYFLQ